MKVMFTKFKRQNSTKDSINILNYIHEANNFVRQSLNRVYTPNLTKKSSCRM